MKSRAELFLILSDVFSSQNQVFHIKFLRKLGFLKQHGQIKQGPCSNRGEGSGFLPGGEQLQSKPQVQLHTRGDKRPDALTTTAWAGLDKSPGTHSREVTFHLRKLPPGNSASQTGRGKGPGEERDRNSLSESCILGRGALPTVPTVAGWHDLGPTGGREDQHLGKVAQVQQDCLPSANAGGSLTAHLHCEASTSQQSQTDQRPR